MYTIELTRGAAWDAPILEVHSIRQTIHVVDVDRMAQQLLNGARQRAKRLSPTDYRILDPLGKCVRSSATAPAARRFRWRTGRTDWGAMRGIAR